MSAFERYIGVDAKERLGVTRFKGTSVNLHWLHLTKAD